MTMMVMIGSVTRVSELNLDFDW